MRRISARPVAPKAAPSKAGPPSPARRKKYVRAVGPRLKVLLFFILGAFALLGANSAYLLSVRLLGWVNGQTYENYFYMWMVLGHVVLGLLIVVLAAYLRSLWPVGLPKAG